MPVHPNDDLLLLERRLAQRARQVSVLEELGLAFEDYEAIRREIALLFSASPSRAVHVLTGYCRHVTAAFLTLVGVYKYAQEAGSARYWALVAEAIGVGSIPPNDQRELGRVVETVVRLGGMAAFPKAEGARRFVDLILLHGGIPSGCLPNYFEHVLANASPSASGQEVIESALESTRRRQLHKPVVRYLLYGGDVASDFVERTVDLAGYAVQLRDPNNSGPDALRTLAERVGLPVRVVRHYRDWLGSCPETPGATAPHRAGRSWKAPSLRFDPVLLGPVVDLPAQAVGEAGAGGRWTVWSEQEAAVLEVPAWRRAQGWRTDPHAHALGAPQAHYDVAWAYAGEGGRWVLPGVTLSRPLMAFHARDGQQVDVSGGLPKDVLWVIRPSSHAFTCEGALLVEGPSTMQGAWGGFVVERWDLGPSPMGAVPRVGDTALALRAEGDVRPHLVPGPVAGVTTDDAPVFSAWPTLHIPRARTGEEVGRWSLRWSSGEAEGVVVLTDSARDTDSGWEVPLEELGLPPFCPLALRLRGPLGRSARFRLAVWDGLVVEGAGRLVLPNDDGSATAELSVVLPTGLRTVGVEGGEHEEAGGRTLVSVRPEADVVRIQVVGEGGGHPLAYSIPRLRSHLFDAATEGPSTALASAAPLHVQGDWLDQAALPRVAFVTGTAGSVVDALEADFGGDDVVECPRVGGRADVFDLSELSQAAASRRSGGARLWARVGRRRVPVGAWHARLGLRGLRASAVEDAEGCEVRLHWDAGRLVSGVRARLWSAWSPWDAFSEADAHPAGERSCFARFAPVQPGRYLVELAVYDPWAPSTPRRPPANGPAVAPLDVGSEQGRRERLAGGTDVRAELTRYLAASGDPGGRSSAWRRACEEASPADVPLFLAVAGLEVGDDLWTRLAAAHRERLFEALERVAERERAAVVGALSDVDPLTLAAYAVALGYFDASPGGWGGQWEPLSACGVGKEALGDPFQLSQLGERLGLVLAEGGAEADATADASEVGIDDLIGARGPFGEAPSDASTVLSADAIQDIRATLGLVPGGPLSPDAQQIGYAEWLIARLEDPAPSDALVLQLPDLKRALRELARVDERLDAVARHALAREHHLASGGERPAWLNAPCAVGAVAALLRASALHEQARTALDGRRAWVRSAALLALQAAPDLLAHDLCWFHLELLDA